MSSLARLVPLVALALALALPGEAMARPGGPATHARPARHATPKRPRPRRPQRPSATSAYRNDNMPLGWSWPPTPAMVASGQACTAELDRLGIAWKSGTATRKINAPITLPGMALGGVKLVSQWRKGPFLMDCQLALQLARHGAELHDLGVREIQFSRIHGYTKVRVGGHTKNLLSRHALGLAMDIYAVVDDQGRTAVVGTDYKQGDALLLAVEHAINGSGGFRTVLTPKNDPISHHDHFHVEASVDYRAPKPTS
jgi:hypothetical protein